MKSIGYILFILCTIMLYGQVNIYADTDKKELRVSEPFTLTIVLDIRGEEFVQESSLKLPDLSKFNIIGSGTNRESVIDKSTNTHINRLLYFIGLEAKKVGTLKMGSVLVQFNGKMYKTEPFDIVVREGNTKELVSDIYFNMEMAERDIYLNQPSILTLRAYSSNYKNLRNIGKITFPNQEDIKILPIDIKPSEIEQDTRSQLISQVVAMAMVLPKNIGNKMVSPASISYNENNIINLFSNKISIRVKEFPEGAPRGFKKVVGDYKIELKCKEEKSIFNQPINIQLKVVGNGSLEKEQLPKILESEDYTLYEPAVKTNIKNTINGREGTIVANYVLIPKKIGKIKVITENFPFFSPNKNKYEDLEAKELTLNIASEEITEEKKSTIEKVSNYTNKVLKVADNSRGKNHKKNDLEFLNKIVILMLFSAISLVLAIWYYRKKLINKHDKSVSLNSSVQDLENSIRKRLPLDLNVHLLYLDKLLIERNFNDFFQNYEEMVSEMEHFVYERYKSDISTYLVQWKGGQYAEAYNRILREVHIEKYAPTHSEEHLRQLLEDTKEIFSMIV